MAKPAEQICKEMKGHVAGIRDLLQGLYGDWEDRGLSKIYACPPNVRNAAYGAICAFNRARLTLITEFEVLHDALGLGPLNWSGPCEHEKIID
jgi:hypothetical protein